MKVVSLQIAIALRIGHVRIQQKVEGEREQLAGDWRGKQ